MSTAKRQGRWVIETGQCVRDDGASVYSTGPQNKRPWRAKSPQGNPIIRAGDGRVWAFTTAGSAMAHLDFKWPLKDPTRSAAELEKQLMRANRIIGWMMPYIGKMCPPSNGLHELNVHCCENRVPEAGADTKGRPINQRPARK